MFYRLFCLSLLLSFVVGSRHVTSAAEPTLLYMGVLAFDNRPNSAGNLEPHYPDTLQRLVQASAEQPNKTAVLLVDLHSQPDHLVVINDGTIVATHHAIPQVNGTLSPATDYEYNVTAGQLLGGFIKWARTTYPSDKTIFSFIGHGTFALPSVGLDAVYDPDSTLSPEPDPLYPQPLALPFSVWGNPDFTDTTPDLEGGSPRLLAPQALREALLIGTDDGQYPIDVTDLVHCFSASVEAFYEISDLTAAITGSANYAYASTDTPAQLLRSVRLVDEQGDPMTATALAADLITAYDAGLANADGNDGDMMSVEHPRTLVAVDASRMGALKVAIDDLAHDILREFTFDPQMTAAQLHSVKAAAAQHYDMSCDGDWRLDKHDALVDVGAWGQAIGNHFPFAPHIGVAGWVVAAAASDAVVAYLSADGQATFATNNWQFNRSDAVGLSLFADFVGTPAANEVTQLSWQVGYYHDDGTQPLRFLQGETTWARVVQRYWQERIDQEGVTVEMQACLPDYPPQTQAVELIAESIVLENSVEIIGRVGADRTVLNPLVRFTILDVDNTPVYSTTVAAGQLVTGTNEVSVTWQPTIATFSIEMHVDPDQALLEQRRDDNTVVVDFEGTLAPTAVDSVDVRLVRPMPWLPFLILFVFMLTIRLTAQSLLSLHFVKSPDF